MNDLIILDHETDIDLWLADVAGKVQHHLGAAAYELYQAGHWLKVARAAVPKGTWQEWIGKNFPFSVETAKRYIRVTTMLDDRINSEKIPLLIAGKTALYELANSETPGPVRDEMLARLEDGQRITLSMIRAAASGAIRAEDQQAAVLESNSDRISALATDIDLDPAVITMLASLEHLKPEVFEEIYASGCVWDAAGESIPLEEANGRDVQAYIDHNRFERQAQGLTEIGAVHIVMDGVKPPTNRTVYSGYGLAQKAHAATAKEDLYKVIGPELDNISPCDRMVDIVYTVYQTIAPYRPSEVWTAGYEKALVEAGVIRATGPLHISSVKVRVRLVNQNPRTEINIYPREELFS